MDTSTVRLVDGNGGTGSRVNEQINVTDAAMLLG